MWCRFIQMHNGIKYIKIWISFLKSLCINIQYFYCLFCCFRKFSVFIHNGSIIHFSYLYYIFIKNFFFITGMPYFFHIVRFYTIFSLLLCIIFSQCLPEANVICFF